MEYLITLINNNGNFSVYIGKNVHGLYWYIEIIGSPTTLSNSGQRSHMFFISPYTNIDIATLRTFIEDLSVRKNIIGECYGRIGHKTDSWITHGPKFRPSNFRINLDKLNTVHGDESTEPPREWNKQTPAPHFKSNTSPPKTSPVVSDIMGRLNNHDIENGDAEVHPSEFPFESNSESVPDTDNTPIK